MMKVISPVFAMLMLFTSCKTKETKDETKIVVVDSSLKPEPKSFFPVTDYIKGQISEIESAGVNPMKYVTINDHTDSTWVKMENFKREVTDFLSPDIDTANLVSLFSEKKFLDQTLDAFTFTYDPIKPLPDSSSLQHWDVYVDPARGQVRRIYIVKNLPGKKTQLLTWQSGKSCNIKNVSTHSSGRLTVEKEITLKWRF